ncbi:U4/U6.U5 tri-snRNP-associated protein-like protein [Emericellopsis cladophorae]|uniref:U4/U6.U5 tri-snRNP-associated protein-like protein n=1 Tax=Emericellopsis cladophorae TaxID=2686198 RepID=A0A9P9XZW4_9HYPO|nr:U4/U6.U5 tri-snRNP-associated protein-like protein [Emericellopsis cladophorae]KAI6780389.1 U4/U6.U5 tri-snRNP-associated protein-like protein [Emericellopsis cladophorae]
MDAATIEETNRIRVSLGMKPLPVPGNVASDSDTDSESEGEKASTVETRQALAYDNYNKIKEAEVAKKKRDERNAAIKKAREKAQLQAQLEGEGLGDAKDADVDTKAWLLSQKKRQKRIDMARKLEEELAAAEAEAAAAVQYTSKDLAGIKVAHDNAAFLDGDDQVLTLKDTNIGAEDEEDELENVTLREQEKLQNRLDLKKKRPGYNPNDEDESGGLLAQYDEEINGKQSKKFTLDSIGAFGELADILDKPVETAEKPQNVSLDDIVGDAPISSDYLAPSEIKIKKSKRKKGKKGTRQKQADDDDIIPSEVAPDSNAMDMNTKDAAPTKKRKLDDGFADDDGDDLQASLAIQRKTALKKRKKMRPEDIAKQMREQGDEPVKEEDLGDHGLVLDETSEFVSGLGKREEEEEPARRRRKATTKTPEVAEPQQDQEMEDAHQEAEDTNVKREDSESAEKPDDSYMDEEKTLDRGMGAALSLLRERGLVEESQGDERFGSLQAREIFLAKKRALEDELEQQTLQQRERDRRSGKLDKMSQREREEYARQQNQWREQQQSRRIAELFSASYKPSFNIKYRDEHGRDLNQKEAFKEMSHQFHGKGSGKGKTEKKLKQISDEKRREAQSLFDATQNSGMTNATAQQLKKRKEAGVRLG